MAKERICRVTGPDKEYYGGDQLWFRNVSNQDVGCGIVACVNVLLCIKAGREQEDICLSKDEFTSFAEYMACSFLRALPKVGINGVFLAAGMNAYFLKERMPYRAFWGCSYEKMWTRIRSMLNTGIPVVLAVGPNNRLFSGRVAVNMYRKEDAGYVKADEARAHYVTVTAIGREYLTVSSWGKKFYISRHELEKYMNGVSNRVVTNILVIERTKA